VTDQDIELRNYEHTMVAIDVGRGEENNGRE
jgi:hypothetical protein